MGALVKRRVAVGRSVIGMLEVFLGTALTICGFIVLGLYRNLSGVGLWAGLPLAAAGLMSMVLLATRHKNAAYTLLLFSFAALCLCIAHTVKTWRDVDNWDTAKTAVDDRKCYDRVDQCICVTKHLPEFFVQRCELYHFGFEIYWAMIGISLAGCVVSLLGLALAALASCSEDDPAKKYYEQQRYSQPPVYAR